MSANNTRLMPIDVRRFAINRCIAPTLTFAEFLKFARGAGISKVELRNDLAANHPIDGLNVGEAGRLIEDYEIEVISINAVQRFNLPSARREALAEIDRLLEISAGIRCPSIVFCPNCEPAESRSRAQRFEDTVEALNAYGPKFTAAGVLAYLEPLGYAYSSMPGLKEAVEAIRKTQFSCYRVLIDSFHHYVGPEGDDVFGDVLAMTALVHVSGVAAGDARQPLRDAQRSLGDATDVIGTREQLQSLLSLGYAGDISFEPYGYVGDASYQPRQGSPLRLEKAELQTALKLSMAYLTA
jgi:2-keto-myo-inositol isomerase